MSQKAELSLDPSLEFMINRKNQRKRIADNSPWEIN